jgi:hypothetical protein
MQFAELDSDKWRQYAAVKRAARAVDLRPRSKTPAVAFEDRSRARSRARWSSATSSARCSASAFPASTRGAAERRRRRALRQPGRRRTASAHLCLHRRHGLRAERRRRVLVRRARAGRRCGSASRRAPAGRRQQAGAAKVQALAQLPGITVTGRVPTTPPWFDRRRGGDRAAAARARRAEQGARSDEHGRCRWCRRRKRRRASATCHQTSDGRRRSRIDHSPASPSCSPSRPRARHRHGRRPLGARAPGAGNACTSASTRCSPSSASRSPTLRVILQADGDQSTVLAHFAGTRRQTTPFLPSKRREQQFAVRFLGEARHLHAAPARAARPGACRPALLAPPTSSAT